MSQVNILQCGRHARIQLACATGCIQLLTCNQCIVLCSQITTVGSITDRQNVRSAHNQAMPPVVNHHSGGHEAMEFSSNGLACRLPL